MGADVTMPTICAIPSITPTAVTVALCLKLCTEVDFTFLNRTFVFLKTPTCNGFVYNAQTSACTMSFMSLADCVTMATTMPTEVDSKWYDLVIDTSDDFVGDGVKWG